MNKDSQYDYEELERLKKNYSEDEMDEVKYHYSRSLYLRSIARYEYVNGNYKVCYEYLKESLNEFATSVNLLNEEKNVSELIKKNIDRKINVRKHRFSNILS